MVLSNKTSLYLLRLFTCLSTVFAACKRLQDNINSILLPIMSTIIWDIKGVQCVLRGSWDNAANIVHTWKKVSSKQQYWT